MDIEKTTRKNIIDQVEHIVKFLKKLENLSPSERLIYFKSISNQEIDLISEVIFNFLHSTIPVDYNSYSRLKLVRDELYNLTNKKKSYNIKRKIIKSLKGLNILNILIPITLRYLPNL